MSVYTDFQKFVNDLEASSAFKGWCTAHAADCTAWEAYRTGLLTVSPPPSPPAASTPFGKALVDVGLMAVRAGLIPPPVHPPLAVAFSFSKNALVASFTDLSTPGPSGPITGWHWDFGDGNTSTLQNPSHTYAAYGTYTATLTVTGTGADGTATVVHSVVLVNVGTATFTTVTAWARPAFTAIRDVPFTTKAQLDAAIANMQAGDYIHYVGTGVLVISNSSGYPLTISGKNPSGTVVFDFGCSRNIWDASKITPNYVQFDYSGTGQFTSLSLVNSSNLTFFGGDMTASKAGAGGLLMTAPCHNITWWDLTVHNVGGSGIQVRGNDINANPSVQSNLSFRAEVYRFSMNPGLDSHIDKGCGFHGLQLHGANGSIHDVTAAIYAHDPLKPGETSAGKVWPEGGGGSGIEPGNDVGSNYSNHTYYVLAENMLMQPNGKNPGSAVNYEVAGNAIEFWGAIPLTNCVVGWVEAVNTSGGCTNGSPGFSHAWAPTSPPITVLHGRGSNTNQYVGGTSHNVAQRYDPRYNLVYQDCA